MGTGESRGTGALIGIGAVVAGLSLAEFAASLKNGLSNILQAVSIREVER